MMESIAHGLPKAKNRKQIRMSKDQLRSGLSQPQVKNSIFPFCVNEIGKEFEKYFIVSDTAKPDNNVMHYVSCLIWHDIKVRNLFSL